MKRALILYSLLLSGIAVSHESSIFDAENIFKSLKVEPVIIMHPCSGKKSLELAGFCPKQAFGDF
jgi:hypothetical protein